jgi:hypothetical protein
MGLGIESRAAAEPRGDAVDVLLADQDAPLFNAR